MSASSVSRIDSHGARAVLAVFALAALVFAAAAAGIWITREGGRVAALWLPNAILVVWLLQSRLPRAWLFAAACIANVGANLAMGDSVRTAVGLSLSNSLEVAVLVWLMAKVGRARPDFASNRDIWCFVLAAIGASVCSGIAATVVLAPPAIDEAVLAWWSWTRADALALLLFVPALTILVDAVRNGADLASKPRGELLATGAVVLVLFIATFFQTRYPLLFLTIPAVLLATFRLGAVGAAGSIMALAVIASIASVIGFGPIHLIKGDLAERLVILQLFLACTFVTSLPVAALMLERARNQTRLHAMSGKLYDASRVFDTLTGLSPAGVFRTAADGSCTYVNPAWIELSGLYNEEWRGFGWSQALHVDDRDRIAEGWGKAVERGDAFSDEFRFVRPDGATRWVEVHASPIWDSDNGITGYVGVNLDITRHKELEESLLLAREQAEGAARAKSEFLANMSHEIRTPMNGVLGFTDLLLGSELDASQRRHVTALAEAGRAMMALLNDILDISKIEAGKLEIVDAPVEIREKVDACIQLFEPVAQARGITLGAQVERAVPRLVMGDKLRLRQVLANLIGNAVKFTNEGAVSVGVRVERGDRQDMLVLEVRDTGIGIPADKLGVIFRQFSQADSSIERTYGGTGLGLTIASNLVRLMDGRIDAVSTEGQGSTFTVRIPLRVAEERRWRQPVEGIPAKAASSSKAARVRILVAEDNELNRLLIEEMLRRGGYESEFAHDGAEAVRMVQEAAGAGDPYALVVMDIQMPDVNGLMATERLRALGHDPRDLPIVALSANCYPDDVARSLAAGMQGHLAKPVRFPELMDAIARFARRGEPVRDAVRTDAGAIEARYRAHREQLAAQLSEASAFVGDAEWEALERALHQLAGTAAHFGEGALGELARRLERQLSAARDDEDRLRIVRDGAIPLLAAA